MVMRTKLNVPRRILNLILPIKRRQLTGSDLEAALLDLDGIALKIKQPEILKPLVHILMVGVSVYY